MCNIMLRQNLRRNPSDHELDFADRSGKSASKATRRWTWARMPVDLMLLVDIRKRNDKDHPLAILSRALTMLIVALLNSATMTTLRNGCRWGRRALLFALPRANSA